MYLMKVWIDQDLCTGDGLCEEIAPDVFVGLDDGLFYVKEGDKVYAEENGNVGGAEGVAAVPKGQEDDEVPEAIMTLCEKYFGVDWEEEDVFMDRQNTLH